MQGLQALASLREGLAAWALGPIPEVSSHCERAW